MTATSTDFTPYEYLTLQVSRELEPLYKDTYRGFGWIIEAGPSLLTPRSPTPNTVTIKLKRDRRLRNRPVLGELQHTAQNALDTIHDIERSRNTAPLAAALAIGIVGCGFLAGSVFTIEANQWVASIPLGAVGLLCWLAGYLVHGRVKTRRTDRTAPLMDEQYEIIYDACEQAARLGTRGV